MEAWFCPLSRPERTSSRLWLNARPWPQADIRLWMGNLEERLQHDVNTEQEQRNEKNLPEGGF